MAASFDTSDLTWWTIIAHPTYQSLPGLEKLKALLSLPERGEARFLSRFMKDPKLIPVSFNQTSPQTVTAAFTFTVDIFYCNGGDNLHGGAQAAIYDMLTSVVFQTVCTPDFWVGAGVSRTLNVSYLRPAPVGLEVLCEIEVVAAGKSLSLQRATMKRVSDGAPLSTCEHHKVAVPTPKI
jgi:acyl-coenzyme A thioesterase PaaI-like protein